jgi:LmbE family N-acetylglucosaminyl deacetylase
MKNRARMNILAIGSHPDDIEFGCGGTLHKYAEKGHPVYMLILTHGEQGGAPARRMREQRASAKKLGATDLFWAEYVDTRLPFYENIIPTIEKVVGKVRPQFAFVHFGRDTHQDHRQASQSAIVATRNVPNVLFYEGPTSFEFTPNVYVDIGESMKTKIKCLACHASQVMKTNVESQSILDIARATAIFRGTQCRRAFAEAFASLRMFILP